MTIQGTRAERTVRPLSSAGVPAGILRPKLPKAHKSWTARNVKYSAAPRTAGVPVYPEYFEGPAPAMIIPDTSALPRRPHTPNHEANPDCHLAHEVPRKYYYPLIKTAIYTIQESAL